MTMLEPDWASLMESFKIKFGSHIPSSSLLAQSFFESFEEVLANSTMKAVTLAHVVSTKEQEDQEDAQPEPSRQMGMHLDSTWTIQTRRRYVSSMPTTTEGLRQKYRILTNCWLLAQMRQLARHLFSDLTLLAFRAFCDELLSDKNFLLEKEIGGHKVIRPEWDLCLGYELDLRREAVKLTKEQWMSIQQAMWAVYRQHRQENLSNFLKLESKKGDESSRDSHIASLERRLKQMENKLNQRSRSSRGKGRRIESQAPVLPAPAQLTLAAPAAPQGDQPKGKGRGKNNRGRRQGKNQNTPSGQNIQTFRELINLKKRIHPEWFQLPPGVCFAFNQKKCTDTACTRLHVCVACGGPRPYEDCRCVQA